MDDRSRPGEPTDAVLSVAALLTKARGQGGVDQLWSLALASQALRERQAPPGPLDRVDRQLRGYLDDHAHGHEVPVPPTVIDALAELAEDQGTA